jgi:hypothetical protein
MHMGTIALAEESFEDMRYSGLTVPREDSGVRVSRG